MSTAHIGTTAWEQRPIGRWVVLHVKPWEQRNYVVYDRQEAEVVYGPTVCSVAVLHAEGLYNAARGQ